VGSPLSHHLQLLGRKGHVQEEMVSIGLVTRQRALKETVAQFYAAELLIALECLHDLGFVYGHLTPFSIHLDNKGMIMIK
jgi:hypothetical protein